MTTNTLRREHRQSPVRLLAVLKIAVLVVSGVGAVTLTIIAFAVQP